METSGLMEWIGFLLLCLLWLIAGGGGRGRGAR